MNKAQAKRALFEIATAIADTVSAAGQMGLPSGHLYARLMAHGCTLDKYEQIIGAMVDAGMIRKSGNLLLPA